jgi:hypothetical protein
MPKERTMQRTRRVIVSAAATALIAAGTGTAIAVAGDSDTSGVGVTAPAFSDPRTIDNPYLPLTAKRRCVLRGRGERSVRTVLDRTRRFTIGAAPVDAAVIRDEDYEHGDLVERTRDYFAQADDGTVYYLGEDVDHVRAGKVVGHRGAWLYGRDTDVPGIVMPAHPQVGDQFRSEDVPGITTESDRVEEAGLRVRIHGVLYTGAIRIQEFVQPEGEVEYKVYAPGVGLVVEYPPDGRSALAGCRG